MSKAEMKEANKYLNKAVRIAKLADAKKDCWSDEVISDMNRDINFNITMFHLITGERIGA